MQQTQTPALAAKLTEVTISSRAEVIPAEMSKLLRKHGNATRLSTAFFADLNAVWEKYGLASLIWLAERDPGRFVEVTAKLCKVQRLEVGQPGEFERPRSRAEVLDKMEERAGTRGREMLQSFLEKLDAMESSPGQGENTVSDINGLAKP